MLLKKNTYNDAKPHTVVEIITGIILVSILVTMGFCTLDKMAEEHENKTYTVEEVIR